MFNQYIFQGCSSVVKECVLRVNSPRKMEKNKFESSPILIFKKDLSPTLKPNSKSPQKKAIADLRIQVLKCN